jgi:hypothetical protein
MLFELGDEFVFQFLLLGFEFVFWESRIESVEGFGAFAVPVIGFGEIVLGLTVFGAPVFGIAVFGFAICCCCWVL